MAAASLLPTLWLVPPAANAGERPGYSYIELQGELSKTGNGWPGVRRDVTGRLIGFAASWKVRESWYLKAGHSRERATFSNDVAGTALTLRTKQAVFTAGGGRLWAVGTDTDLYAEGLVLHSSVDHDIPDMQQAAEGPPAVGRRAAEFEDSGFGAAVGVRHMLNAAAEVEVRLEARTVHDHTETAIRLAGRKSLADSLSLGLYISYGDTTKRNHGATARIGAALRHGF